MRMTTPIPILPRNLIGKKSVPPPSFTIIKKIENSRYIVPVMNPDGYLYTQVKASSRNDSKPTLSYCRLTTGCGGRPDPPTLEAALEPTPTGLILSAHWHDWMQELGFPLEYWWLK